MHDYHKRTYIRCKLEIEQVMNFSYLGLKIISDGILVEEVTTQAYEAAKVVGYCTSE